MCVKNAKRRPKNITASNQIQMKTTRLQEISRTTGLEINVDKTKCLRINPGNTHLVLTLEDKPLKMLIHISGQHCQ